MVCYGRKVQERYTSWRTLMFDFIQRLTMSIVLGDGSIWRKNTSFQKKDYSERWPRSTCFDMHLAIVNLLRAGIMACKVRFPFTRDVRMLYEMLSLERRPPLDVDAAAIREKYDENKDETGWTQVDVAKAQDMVRRVYHFTCGNVKTVVA